MTSHVLYERYARADSRIFHVYRRSGVCVQLLFQFSKLNDQRTRRFSRASVMHFPESTFIYIFSAHRVCVCVHMRVVL